MPAITTELVTRLEAKMKKAVGALGKDVDPAKRRKLGKKLRRTQRKRRRLSVEDERRKGKPKSDEAKKED